MSTESYECSLSTTWTPQVGKIRPSAERQRPAPPKAARRWWGLPERRMRQGVTVKLRYWGGPEGRVWVEARGRSATFHGCAAILDVLREVNQCIGGYRD